MSTFVTQAPRLLNVGCGYRYHAAWTNVDQVATGEGVVACDLRSGICFPGNTFEAVYHSNFLEHLDLHDAGAFISECHRVLAPGGILRVVVPDLEGIVRSYLMALDRAGKGQPGGDDDHKWMVTELLDQMVRTVPGGEMRRMLADERLPNHEFIVSRIGQVGVAESQNPNRSGITTGVENPVFPRLTRLFRNPRLLREVLIKRLLGREYPALVLGRFRLGGEVHQWMYDAFSLGRLLEQTGFTSIRRVAFNESGIPKWDDYGLESDGPALRMEARKDLSGGAGLPGEHAATDRV